MADCSNFEVTVFPKALQPYTSQIYTGLYDLADDGVIELRFSAQPPVELVRKDKMLEHVWLSLEDRASGDRRLVLFDMVDAGGFRVPEHVEVADVVLKRGYDRTKIDLLPEELRPRVWPFGLHFACRSRREMPRWRFAQQFRHHELCGNWRTKPLASALKTIGKTLQVVASRTGAYSGAIERAFAEEDFLGSPDDSVRADVFFRTRLYDAPNDRQRAVNESRVALVRALRSHYGPRFVGGLRRSAIVEREYPDCLASQNMGAGGHLAESRRHLINVNTAGLHNSTGWKLPEILASARCLVSEAPVHELPAPLVHGEHYMSFTTTEECIAVCDRMLDDPGLATSLRRSGVDYYEKYVKPAAVIHRALQRAAA